MHIKDCSKSRFIISSWLSKVRCCSTINIHHPFKPEGKICQPDGNGDESDHRVGPLSIFLPKHKLSNGDIMYTNNSHASVTTILKNSMSYGDQIRILKWKEKARTQLGHLEYTARQMANDDDRSDQGEIDHYNNNKSDDNDQPVPDDDLNKLEHDDANWASRVEKNHILTTSQVDNNNNNNDDDDDDDQAVPDDDLNKLEHEDDNWASHVEKNHKLTASRLKSIEDELGRHELPENISTEELKLYEAIGNLELQKYVKLIRKRGHSLHEVRKSE